MNQISKENINEYQNSVKRWTTATDIPKYSIKYFPILDKKVPQKLESTDISKKTSKPSVDILDF